MTNRERLFKVLSGETPDRVPIWLLFPYHTTGYYVDVRTHPKYKSVFEESKKYAIMLNRRSLDIAPHTPDCYGRHNGIALFTPEVVCRQEKFSDKGCEVIRTSLEYKGGGIYEEYRKGSSGAKVKKLLSTDEDLEFYCSLPVETDPECLAAELQKRLPQYLQEKEEFPLEYGAMMLDLGEPVLPLYLGAKLDEYAVWSLTRDARIIEFLDRMLERLRVIYKWCLERDLADVYFLVGSEMASPPLVSGKTFQKWIVPYAKELIDIIHSHGKKVIQHYHGQIKQILPDFIDMSPDGLHTIEAPPIGNCTFTEAFDIVGDKIALIGNIQYDCFSCYTQKQMRQAVKQVIDECKGKKFILSPTAGPFDEQVSDNVIKNYLEFMKAGYEFGKL